MKLFNRKKKNLINYGGPAPERTQQLVPDNYTPELAKAAAMANGGWGSGSITGMPIFVTGSAVVHDWINHNPYSALNNANLRNYLQRD